MLPEFPILQYVTFVDRELATRPILKPSSFILHLTLSTYVAGVKPRPDGELHLLSH
jgi:hypothetical protein